MGLLIGGMGFTGGIGLTCGIGFIGGIGSNPCAQAAVVDPNSAVTSTAMQIERNMLPPRSQDLSVPTLMQQRLWQRHLATMGSAGIETPLNH